MMKTFSPEIYFKGKRDYINAATLYEVLMNEFQHCYPSSIFSSITMQFRKVLKNEVVFIALSQETSPSIPTDAILEFTIGSDNNFFFGWGLDSKRPVSKRLPYDEDPIVKNTKFKGSDLYLKAIPSIEPVQVIVSMIVMLHNKLLPANQGKKWLLTGLEFVRPPMHEDLLGLYVNLEKIIGNIFTRTAIITKTGDRLGRINFVLKDYP